MSPTNRHKRTVQIDKRVPARVSSFQSAMTSKLFGLGNHPTNRWWIETLMACRAMFFSGARHKCPCCGWKLRAFTAGGTSLKARDRGYCPRCNSKARHRRDWLFLANETNLFTERLRLLHVAPKYALSRRFARMPNLQYVGVDLEGRPNISAKVDLTAIPFNSSTFDAIVCIHVLEHIEDDRQAIRELYRVLKPGGWALLSVPIRFDHKTHEDPAITTAAERETAYGEAQHVRLYGSDFGQRLESGGFRVRLDRARGIDQPTKDKYGLLDDENVFYCLKPHEGGEHP